MKQATRFTINPGWKILLSDMGINHSSVLSLAGLPADLFSRKAPTLSVKDYLGFWEGIELAAGNKEVPLLIGQILSVETLDPASLACLCSPNLNVALQRLSDLKCLTCPMLFTVNIEQGNTSVTIDYYQHEGKIPHSLGVAELVFITKLARLATRQHIVPTDIVMKALPNSIAQYEAYFGVPIHLGVKNKISFATNDVLQPLLTENIEMWKYFDSGLKQRVLDLDTESTTSQLIQSELLEMLPSGQSSMALVADRLAMSKRTIQRRLSGEGINFQMILQKTRKELAEFYLANSSMSLGEISFMLGFHDTNSFIRAYGNWTGKSPGQYREMQ
jgi:AraC-like DNA-binding protein